MPLKQDNFRQQGWDNVRDHDGDNVQSTLSESAQALRARLSVRTGLKKATGRTLLKLITTTKSPRMFSISTPTTEQQ